MDIKNNSHFWATINEKLLVIIKDSEDNYWVCGGWECPVYEEQFMFIDYIDAPESHKDTKLYYE